MISQITNYIQDSFSKYARIDSQGNVYLGDEAKEYEVVKVNLDGDTLWHYELPVFSPDPVLSFARSKEMALDEEDNLYIAGEHSIDSSSLDIVTSKLDSNGNLLWQNRYSYEDKELNDSPADVHVNDNYVFVVGTSKQDSTINDYIFLIYSKEEGEEIAALRYDDDDFNFERATSVTTFGKNIYLSGVVRAENLIFEPPSIQTQRYEMNITSSTRLIDKNDFIKIFPNPLSHVIILEQEQGAIFYQDYEIDIFPK